MTKIPERSLERLEAGRFADLPGDVFVRGFLRSYARCVGLDPEEIVRTYGELATKPDKVRREVAATSTGESREATPPRADAPPAPPDPGALAKGLADAGFGTRRISLTLAVIILVIVATLTLSLLLRRPSHVGSGVSSLPSVPTSQT